MFIFLSKLLPPFFYPLGLAILLIAAALFLWRKVRLQRILLILALLILFLGSNRLVAAGLVRGLEYQYQPLPEITQHPETKRAAPLAPVIVLLGGGTESHTPPRPMVEVNGAGDRVLYAVQLYRLGYAPKILVTGGNIEWMSSGPSPAEDMAELLHFMGVPQEDIWLEGESRNTYENAVYTREILEPKGIHSIILVTSAQHMPRSVGLFAKQGFEVLPAPADFSVTETEWEKIAHPKPIDLLFNLLPGISNLSATTNSLKEYLGMFIYRLRGWM